MMKKVFEGAVKQSIQKIRAKLLFSHRPEYIQFENWWFEISEGDSKNFHCSYGDFNINKIICK